MSTPPPDRRAGVQRFASLYMASIAERRALLGQMTDAGISPAQYVGVARNLAFYIPEKVEEWAHGGGVKISDRIGTLNGTVLRAAQQAAGFLPSEIVVEDQTDSTYVLVFDAEMAIVQAAWDLETARHGNPRGIANAGELQGEVLQTRETVFELAARRLEPADRELEARLIEQGGILLERHQKGQALLAEGEDPLAEVRRRGGYIGGSVVTAHPKTSDGLRPPESHFRLRRGEDDRPPPLDLD